MTTCLLDKGANPFVPGVGKMSAGGKNTLGSIYEDEVCETGSRPEIQCNGSNIRTRQFISIRDRRASRSGNINPSGPNANDKLTEILNKLPINDLLELKSIQKLNRISIDPKFGDFNRWKRKTTSIPQQDEIITLAINEAIKEREESKEEEPSPYNEVTEDEMIKTESFIDDDQADDEDEYDPMQDPAFQDLYDNNNDAKATPAVLSPSVQTQPRSITNSPPPTMQSTPCTPPTPSTPMVDINPYLQTLQQLPVPSYWQIPVPSTPNPNMPPMQMPANYIVPAIISPPVQPLAPVLFIPVPLQQPLQPNYNPNMPSMSMPNNNGLFSVPQTAVSMPMINQFNLNNNNATQPITTQATEQKEQTFNYNQNNNHQMNERQFAAPTTKKFQAKFNNHAKGNFYISKEKIGEMIEKAAETFNTEEKDDEKLAFGHYKESVAMSINDGQIDAIFQTQDGKLMIIINIDLHFRSNPLDVMYLIATENDEQYRDRVRWCIVDFMSAEDIIYKYKGITREDLPKSSRNMKWFKKGIDRAPVGFTRDQVQKITRNTHFKTLPKKTSKRAAKKNEGPVYKSRISQQRLKKFVEDGLLDDHTFPIVPVVVIKGKNQCIEWKRFVQIEDDDGYIQYVGISLKFYDGNKQWKIECMDYDSGRVYYQHRLASLPADSVHHYSYDQVSQCITTSMLDIYDEKRSNYHEKRRGYHKNSRNNYQNYSSRYQF